MHDKAILAGTLRGDASKFQVARLVTCCTKPLDEGGAQGADFLAPLIFGSAVQMRVQVPAVIMRMIMAKTVALAVRVMTTIMAIVMFSRWAVFVAMMFVIVMHRISTPSPVRPRPVRA